MDSLDGSFNPGKDLVVAFVQLSPQILRKRRAMMALHFSMYGALFPNLADPDELRSEIVSVNGQQVMLYFIPGRGPGALQMVRDNPLEKGNEPKSPEAATKSSKPDPFQIKDRGGTGG